MINYPLHSKDTTGLVPISADVATHLIKQFNVYFRIYAVPNDEFGYRNFNFDLIDHSIYQLDNLKDFDRQYASIKSIHFTFDTTVYFYTDYRENKPLIYNRLKLSSKVLKSQSKSITMTNLKNETKISKSFILDYLSSLEKNPTLSLFEFEDISPNIHIHQNNKQPKGVSTVPISSLNNVCLAVGLDNVH
jgi:hypothetical protein